MLDLFSGRWGWSKAFAARGWECVGIDLIPPPEIPNGCTFICADVMTVTAEYCRQFDFICASSPCEEFAVYGMRHFHPHPDYPTNGLRLFVHTRQVCELSGVPYVMENVRPAQTFVGRAAHHCGPFYLWGTGVPVLVNQGITKGFGKWDRKYILNTGSSKSKKRQEYKAKWATIPPELSGCVADHAEWLTKDRGESISDARWL
jgi:hypothetical protein